MEFGYRRRADEISIHAPNEGSDRNIWAKKYLCRQILVLLFQFYFKTLLNYRFDRNIRLLKYKISANLTLNRCEHLVRNGLDMPREERAGLLDHQRFDIMQ